MPINPCDPGRTILVWNKDWKIWKMISILIVDTAFSADTAENDCPTIWRPFDERELKIDISAPHSFPIDWTNNHSPIFINNTYFFAIFCPLHVTNNGLVSIVDHFLEPHSLETRRERVSHQLSVVAEHKLQFGKLQTLWSIHTIIKPCWSLVVNFSCSSFHSTFKTVPASTLLHYYNVHRRFWNKRLLTFMTGQCLVHGKIAPIPVLKLNTSWYSIYHKTQGWRTFGRSTSSTFSKPFSPPQASHPYNQNSNS